MEKRFKWGDTPYLRVKVENVRDEESNYDYSVSFEDMPAGERSTIYVSEEQLLTAEDIALVINTERDEALEELKAKVAKLEAENDEWQKTAQTCADNAKVADVAADSLRAERDRLKKALEERAENVMNLLEMNDKLKAERDDLRSQVGKNLAEIQDLNAEVHFHKEFGEGIAKQQNELQARYDELDSVNHEQAEKIRKLDKALTDLKQRNDKLQDENTNLSFLLEAQPEEEATRTVHVVLNDGTGYNFFKCTKASFDNYADFTVLKIYRGEEYVAGFLRGDKPGNLAYWWTE